VIQTLLVLDDQRLDRVIATHAGSQAGLQATGVATIEEARARYEDGAQFDFVVLDLSLGEQDGLEALPLIAARNRDAVIIFASGFDIRVLAASQRLASSLGLQVGGVLRKPIIPARLMDMLRPRVTLLQAPPDAGQGLPQPNQLRAALDAGAIRPWFQPKMSLHSGAVVGTEALARWLRPDGSLVPPEQFIPLAETGGMALDLALAMLHQSLAACAQWRLSRPECWVAVNLSPTLLTEPTMIERIDECLKAHGVPPSALVLEITESAAIPDTPRVMELLTRLRIRGVGLSIDDFGTGHSSLLSLVRMPFSEMKIDQRFVREALSDRDSRKAVRASASLGRELGLNVVAEGVETAQQAELVQDAGCDVGQGWLWGKAMPLRAFERFLGESATETSAA